MPTLIRSFRLSYLILQFRQKKNSILSPSKIIDKPTAHNVPVQIVYWRQT